MRACFEGFAAKRLAASLAGLLLCADAGASELKFTFQQPGFGGNPLASNYYMGMLENQKLVKKKEEDRSGLPGSQSAIASFAESLKSRILSALASKITKDIFGSDSTQGTFAIDSMMLDYRVAGDTVVVNLTDGVTNTTITVPRFEIDKTAGSTAGF